MFYVVRIGLAEANHNDKFLQLFPLVGNGLQWLLLLHLSHQLHSRLQYVKLFLDVSLRLSKEQLALGCEICELFAQILLELIVLINVFDGFEFVVVLLGLEDAVVEFLDGLLDFGD